MKKLFLLFFLAFISIAHSETINVPADQATIQAGIDDASSGDTVLVANGTYLENINYNGKAITVASHYIIDQDTSHISNTIIDGSNPSNPDSGSVVTFESGEDTTSVLYGFTITSGTGTIVENIWEGVELLERDGGGILCYNSGALIIYNKITNNNVSNFTYSWGGGIAAVPNASDAHIVVKNNQIINNSVTGEEQAGSSALLVECNADLINNIISHNTANSGGVASGAIDCISETQPRTVVITNNYIHYNITNGVTDVVGGGLNIANATAAIITDNKISHNEANGTPGQGGGILIVLNTRENKVSDNIISNNISSNNGGGVSLFNNSGNTLLSNNIISANTALDGGGIKINDSESQIINNTIVNNNAERGGGISTDDTNNPVFINSIIWNNKTTNNTQVFGNIKAHYSNIQGGASGIGNIDSDPMFADTLFHLSEYSPSIGSAISEIEIDGTVYYSPENDYAGNLRPNPIDNYIDMGALESSYPVKSFPSETIFPDKYLALNSVPAVNVDIFNPNSEDISVYAKTMSIDSIVSDSTELFDDGEHNDGDAADGLYGGHLNSVNHEAIYKTAIGIDYNNSDKFVYFNDTTRFATFQVEYADSGDERFGFAKSIYEFSLFLNNKSNTATVKALSATIEVIFQDSCFSAIVNSTSEFDDLGPGQTAESNKKYKVILETACQDNNVPFTIRIDIASDGYLFWQETLNLIATDLEDTKLISPKEFAVYQNFPNPFNPTTNISYDLPQTSDVDLSVFNLLGQKVASLVSKKQTAGSHQVEWDATGFASGVYLYRLETNNGYKQTKKLVLLK